MLLAGKDLLLSLMGTLSRFRENKFAMTADIEKMFLQVEVKPEDRKFCDFFGLTKTTKLLRISTIGTFLELSHLQHVQTLPFNNALWIMHLYSSVQVEWVHIILYG